MRVAVTGAGGSIGRALVPFLRERGHDVVAAPPKSVMDMALDVAGLRAWIAAAVPDVVIHLAGAKPPAPPYAILATNVAGTHNLLDAVRGMCPSARVVVTSSAAVHGEPPSPYGTSKRIAEVLTRHARESGARASVVRIANVVGAEGDRTSALPQLLERIRSASPGSRVEIRDADCTRDFILVDDVVAAFDVLSNRSDLPDLIEIGSGQGTTILDLAGAIAEKINPGVVLDPREWKGEGIRDAVSDTATLRSFGWQPRYEPREAIAEAIVRYERSA